MRFKTVSVTLLVEHIMEQPAQKVQVTRQRRVCNFIWTFRNQPIYKQHVTRAKAIYENIEVLIYNNIMLRKFCTWTDIQCTLSSKQLTTVKEQTCHWQNFPRNKTPNLYHKNYVLILYHWTKHKWYSKQTSNDPVRTWQMTYLPKTFIWTEPLTSEHFTLCHLEYKPF